MASAAPAVCDDCGTIFPSGFVIGPRASVVMAGGNKSGPCPNCGGMGSVPDGLYEFVGETLRVVSSWTPERIQRLSEALQAARNEPDPRAATEAALAGEEDLLDVAKTLLIPRDAGQFWALVAALVALLALLSASQTDENITVNVETVIERTVTEAEAPPTTQRPRPDVKRMDIPKQRKKRAKRRRK